MPHEEKSGHSQTAMPSECNLNAATVKQMFAGLKNELIVYLESLLLSREPIQTLFKITKQNSSANI